MSSVLTWEGAQSIWDETHQAHPVLNNIVCFASFFSHQIGRHPRGHKCGLKEQPSCDWQTGWWGFNQKVLVAGAFCRIVFCYFILFLFKDLVKTKNYWGVLFLSCCFHWSIFVCLFRVFMCTINHDIPKVVRPFLSGVGNIILRQDHKRAVWLLFETECLLENSFSIQRIHFLRPRPLLFDI